MYCVVDVGVVMVVEFVYCVDYLYWFLVGVGIVEID